MKNVTVFLYHDIETRDPTIDRDSPTDAPYVLDTKSFRSQLKCLSNNGYPVISLADVVRASDQKCDFKSPRVCLTFDDGHVSNHTHALPILQESGYTACFFITVNEIGSQRYLSWRQIRALAQAGMEIGSHGLTHLPMSLLSARELVRHLRVSKEILEDRLGRPTRFFSSPTGYPDQRLVPLARSLGYEAICIGPVVRGRDAKDPFVFRRLDVKRGLPTQAFARLAAQRVLPTAWNRGKEEVLFWSKQCLGIKGYERLRQTLLVWKEVVRNGASQRSLSRICSGDRKEVPH